jgi:small subunit ribosomal protein S18
MQTREPRESRGKGRFKSFAEKGRCRFCRIKGFTEIDYKDLATLQKLCTSQGKMYSRKRSGNCAGHQRELKLAIKRARFMGLLPYISK